ncbi:hypothetical protein [Subtercola sp. YIM 133946]|uniref:hypothetical protein n=1 Tax=Subtercola sp. YIM 133946 TaxID=3118909 RepID=UPI002F95105C
MSKTTMHRPARTISDDALSAAWHAADAVAAASGVTVTIARTPEQSHAISTVLAEIWPQENGASQLEANLLRALEFSGNYVSLATTTDVGEPQIIGACVGFFGPPAEHHLHSHIAGVSAHRERHGVGRALKLHQRAWALERGTEEISWTFDPLIARNANFNLSRLGVEITAYIPDFYGPMIDLRNAGQHSDRLVATWRLQDARVVALARGERRPFDSSRHVTEVAGGGLAAAADVTEWISVNRGEPVLIEGPASTRLATPEAATLGILRVPADYEGLRSDDAALAGRWRDTVREALARTVGAGESRIVGFEKNVGYLLEALP